MRTGAELVQASNAFTQEDPAKTWRLLLTTLGAYSLAFAGAVAAPHPALQAGFSVLTGLIIIRIFIFYHDFLHGAIFRQSKAGALLMRVFGWWMLAGPSVWKQTHDYHHKNNAKMLGASIGSFPIVTVEIWKGLSPANRRDYKIARHPLTMMAGYVTVFVIGMCISAFRRNPTEHRDGLIALIVHFGCAGLLWAVGGWQAALFGMILPHAFTCALGSYLFYAQHNFPGMQLRNRRDWDYSFAALSSSSMFDMTPVFHWFTGNIGYHHVHHLNHRIPFYRLPEAMATMPELQSPGRTSWRIRDILDCLALKIWDPAAGRMISYAEADAQIGAAPAK